MSRNEKTRVRTAPICRGLLTVALIATAIMVSAVNAEIIAPTGASQNQSAYPGTTDATNLIDPTQTVGTQLTQPAWADMYLGNEWDTFHHWVYIDLGAVYNLEEIRIWNYNDAYATLDLSGRGVKNMSIHVGGAGAALPATATPVGTNDTDGLPNAFLDTGWSSIFDGDLAQGQDTTTTTVGALVDAELVLDATGVNGVRYIGIDIDSRWFGSGAGSGPYTSEGPGLNYVQVEGTLVGMHPDYQASAPYPANDADGLPLVRTLAWTAPVAFAPSGYTVYMDPNEALVAAGDVSVDVTAADDDGDSTNTYFVTPADLLENTTYYWRVDSHDGGTVYEGQMWNFTTSVAAPATLVQTVNYIETITMRLTKENLRGDHFELWAQNASGDYDVITPAGERSYLGTVDEYPGAISCGVLLDSGEFMGAVYFDRGEQWFTLGSTVFKVRAVGYINWSEFHVPTVPWVTAGQGGTTMYGFDVGVDASYSYFANRGILTYANSLEMIEYSVNNVRALYMRDALLKPALGRIILRADLSQDPYAASMKLDNVRNQWNWYHTDATRDVVCGVDPRFNGGLAMVGVAGDPAHAYSANNGSGNGAFDIIWRHELGHNWSSGHYVGGSPEGPGIMGGNQPARFSGCEAFKLMSYRDAYSGAWDNEGTYTAIDIPPYAAIDAVETSAGQAITIDIMANDFDANGDTISLDTYDTTSKYNSTITLSAGTGPDGRDQLIYHPTNVAISDHFLYRVIDSSGQTATGVVVLNVGIETLKLYWPLDEGSGSDVNDITGYGNNGAMVSMDPNTDWVGGKYDGGLDFDGVDDEVWGPGGLPTGSMTVSVWLKPDVSGNGTHRRAVSKGYYEDGWQLGLNNVNTAEFAAKEDGNTLRVLNGTTAMTTSTWNHLVGVYDIDTDTIYLYVNGTLEDSTSITSTSGGIMANGNPFRIGTAADALYFPGAIDEVRYYNYAVDQAGVDALYAGGRAENPNPADMTSQHSIASTLSWLPGPTAIEHDVYLGTDYDAVLNATTVSDEYMGRQSGIVYDPNLYCGSRYYWRIDEYDGSSVIAGDVWEFTTGTLITPAVDDFSSQNPAGLARYAFSTVDSSGLTGDGSAGSTHAVGDDGISWTTAGSYDATDYDPYITYDLGSICNVTTIREWGSNSDVGSIFGPDEVDIYTSTDGVAFMLATTVNFAQAPGVNGYAGNDIAVNLSDVRYIKLDFMTNHDGAVFDGTGTNGGTDGRSLLQLHEIRFEGKPDLYDGSGGMADLAGFAGHWLDSGCVDLPACGAADLDNDQDVDLCDFAIFGSNWVSGI